MTYRALRAFTVDGVAIAIGASVDTSTWPDGKAAQLVNQRFLTDADDRRPSRFLALRMFRIGKRAITRGERVPRKGLTDRKVAQLLEQRYLDPVLT